MQSPSPKVFSRRKAFSNIDSDQASFVAVKFVDRIFKRSLNANARPLTSQVVKYFVQICVNSISNRKLMILRSGIVQSVALILLNTYRLAFKNVLLKSGNLINESLKLRLGRCTAWVLCYVHTDGGYLGAACALIALLICGRHVCVSSLSGCHRFVHVIMPHLIVSRLLRILLWYRPEVHTYK